LWWSRGVSFNTWYVRRGEALTAEGMSAAALTGEIVGREVELAACERLLVRVAEGPAALVVEGAAGIGKTTVWRAGVAAAAGRGFAVLRCRPAEAEARLSYSGLGDLLGPLVAAVLPQLPEPQRFALEAALLERDGGGRPPDRRTVSVGVLTALRALAAGGPVLLAVDDVQWLDAPTRRLLEYALRRVREERLAVLVSMRTGAGAAALPLELETFADSRREHVRLGPLSLAALHHLLGSRLGLSPPRPVLVRIHHAAAGNPFYALEIARLLRDSDALPQGRLPIPGQVKELLAARLRRLPAATREALLVAACLSRPSIELLDVEALAPAEQAGIVSVQADGRVGFTHPLFASAVYDGATAARRRSLHLQLAEQVTSVEERARHLALGTTGRDGRVAAEVRAGAGRALARGAPDAAAELYEQAQRLSDEREQQLACAVVAAECHLRAGDMSAARDLLAAAVAERPAGPLGARALWRLADVHLYQDDYPAALGLLERARAQAGEGELAAEIELDLAYTHNAVGDMTAADPHAQQAVRLAGRLERPGLLAEALAVASMTGFLLGRAVDWERLERALALEDWDRPSLVLVRPTLIAALLYSWTGELARGQSLFDELQRQLLERGDESGLVMGSFCRIAPDCWRGDIGGACQHAGDLCERAALLGGDAMHAAALAAASLAHAYAGEEMLVRCEAAEALALFARVGWAVGRAWPVMALGMLELSLGNPAAAQRVLSPLTEFMRQVGLAEPWGSAPFLPDAVEALVRLGHLEEAQPLLAELEATAARVDRAAALAAASRCRALLLAEHGDAEAAWNAIGQALRQHDRVPMPVERARTLLVKGQLERRARRWRAAQESMQQALAIFERAGAAAWAGQARTELGRVCLYHRPQGELTDSERRVAGLAATGLTNREVAAQLFMSPKTVEANLARAYRKLGIRSRAELGARLGAE
jgi:DNA-binding CsgD family transcriptional regulator